MYIMFHRTVLSHSTYITHIYVYIVCRYVKYYNHKTLSFFFLLYILQVFVKISMKNARNCNLERISYIFYDGF